jgi:dipeptide/tripeptide permease
LIASAGERRAAVLAAAQRCLITLWVGALWTIGYVAAPVLFASLEQPAEAGRLAGNMFTVVAYLSFAAGGALLLILLTVDGWRPRWRAWMVAAMLVLIAVGELVVRPLMTTAAPADFGRLHGIAQSIYLLVSLLGLLLAAGGPSRRSR